MENSNNELLRSLTESETEVCEILLNLGHIIYESQLPPKWGTRKRRSAALEPTSLPPAATFSGGDHGGAAITSPKKVQETILTTSPDTPLAFPKEFDHNSKHSSEISFKKMRREDLLATIEESTKTRDELRKELKNVNRYYKWLIAYNKELKETVENITAVEQMNNPLNYGMVNHDMGPRGVIINHDILSKFQAAEKIRIRKMLMTQKKIDKVGIENLDSS